MSEKMLVTQALDERDLLVKKINDKINKASFTDTKKHNEEKVAEGKILSADFEKDAKVPFSRFRISLRDTIKLMRPSLPQMPLPKFKPLTVNIP